MADELLTDQQQGERVKDWFRENGLFIVGGVILGLGGLFGWNQWQGYQVRQAAQASAVYELLLQSVRSQNLEAAQALVGELERNFGATPYLDQGRLAVARLHLDRNNPTEAAAHLEQVVKGGTTEPMRRIASLRLARLRIFQERPEEALDLLRNPGKSAFAAAYHDVRGDALYALGRFDEARREYELALSSGDGAGMLDRGLVEAKRDDLSTAPAPVAPPAGQPAG